MYAIPISLAVGMALSFAFLIYCALVRIARAIEKGGRL